MGNDTSHEPPSVRVPDEERLPQRPADSNAIGHSVEPSIHTMWRVGVLLRQTFLESFHSEPARASGLPELIMVRVVHCMHRCQ